MTRLTVLSKRNCWSLGFPERNHSPNKTVAGASRGYPHYQTVVGNFTSGIYTEDCIFEDPTIKFRGKDLYSRNLKLLVPFFEHPSISLQNIKKVMNSETESVMASWRLRTYLKLPWRPLILIDGITFYALDNQFRIVKHVESWSVNLRYFPFSYIGLVIYFESTICSFRFMNFS
ncbi:hypothetical protein LXL04_019663 [Taraxacum kok-saghyz]